MKKCVLGSKAGAPVNVRVDWSAAAVADLKMIAEWIEQEQDRDLEMANQIARAIYDAAQSPAQHATPWPVRRPR